MEGDTAMREPKEQKPAVPLMRAKEALYEAQRREWERQLQKHKICRNLKKDSQNVTEREDG